MKGLEIAREYYLTYGKKVFEDELNELTEKIAVGLCGEGSECFGFDDALSTDHDFEPAFCVWITREDYEKFGFKLEKAYLSLPKEFKGLKKQSLSPVGGNRHGVMIIDDFYNKFLGTPSAPVSLEQWLYIPTHSLACASNGEVFSDNEGSFSETRNILLKGFPRDVLLKKLSAHLIMMLQTGVYNYERSIKRGEKGTAQLCIFEFVKHTISVIYLLNNKYEPFYKWAYKGMRELKILSFLEDSLVALTELSNNEIEARTKIESIGEICGFIIEEVKRQGLTDYAGTDIEKCAISLQNKIKDLNLRNMHIMEGI